MTQGQAKRNIFRALIFIAIMMLAIIPGIIAIMISMILSSESLIALGLTMTVVGGFSMVILDNELGVSLSITELIYPTDALSV